MSIINFLFFIFEGIDNQPYPYRGQWCNMIGKLSCFSDQLEEPTNTNDNTQNQDSIMKDL